MIETSLELQKAIRTRLVSTPAVTALVPAASIFDGPSRPEKFPCVIVGEAMTALEALTLSRSHVRAVLDVHLWTKGADLAAVKIITGVVQAALRDKPAIDGLHVIDWLIPRCRFMRDPGGEYGHAVMSIDSLVGELA